MGPAVESPCTLETVDVQLCDMKDSAGAIQEHHVRQ